MATEDPAATSTPRTTTTTNNNGNATRKGDPPLKDGVSDALRQGYPEDQKEKSK